MLAGLILTAAIPAGGCGPPIPPEDLGTVLDQAPEFPAEESPADATQPAAPTPDRPESPRPAQ
jgi:hypothetical protein